MKGNNGWLSGMMFLSTLLLLVPIRGLALPMTGVQGVVYRADGSTAQGTLLVSWPAFTASDGSAIAAGNTTASIASDGSVSMSLTPNAGATPQGTYYTVVYHLNDGTVSTEYWVVPQAATATISQMRARVVPAAVAQQSVSQQYVDASISAIQGSYLQLQGGTMSGALNLSSDPDSAMQAATKQYVDTHAAANLPANAIPFQGGVGTSPTAATPANIAGLYSSTGYVTDTYIALSTTFNEAASGPLVGTKPAIDAKNVGWSGATNNGWYIGSGASFTSNGVVMIPTGVNSGTYTLSGVNFVSGGSTIDIVFNVDAAYTKGLLLDRTSAGVFTLEDNGTGGMVVLQSATIAATTGNITVTIDGQSVSANVFGTVLSGTIPAESVTLHQNYFAVNGSPGSQVTMAGLQVQATGLVPSTVSCSGFLNSDGTCSASGTNTMTATDGSGHLSALPEKGTVTAIPAPGQAPVTSIAWQDDFGAGIYDPRDPRWGPQDTQAHQAAALQAMSNQMACDMATGKVGQAVAKFPQGSFAVDNLLAAPGSQWIGSPLADGGTVLYTFVNNHYGIQMPLNMTLTCSDGLSHTDAAGLGLIEHFTVNGCGEGGCSNAPGDTAIYYNGGPGNIGVTQIGNGTMQFIFSQNFGGAGIVANGQDNKAFHLRTYNNQQWYYYGGYKGLGESAAGPETSAVVTGTTGSVALTWAAVPNATGYVVYRGSAPGGEGTSYIVNTNSFTDTCTASYTGGAGTVTNVVTETAAAAPGTISATPSSTGGTCGAGTYYYKVTSTTTDGWHGSVEIGGLDSMADWVEAYGLFDGPTAFTYHHIADILSGGGDSHFGHFWPQLGLVGIAQPYGYGNGDRYSNFRVDFTRQEGIWTTDVNVFFNDGIIDASCTAPNAATINTGQQFPDYAGTCTQFFSGGQANNLDNVFFAYNNGFGTSVATADILMGDGASKILNTNGTLQYVPLEGVKGGGLQRQYNAGANVTGPTPTITQLSYVAPQETTPTTYTGFMKGEGGQLFFVQGGNANVTLQNNSAIKTCSGRDINLGTVPGLLQFAVVGGAANGLYGLPIGVAQICGSQIAQTVSSAETVAFSATPTFSILTRDSEITLTGNVTSFTLAGGATGQEKTLIFCQNATGGYTVTPPANVRGFMTVGTTAGKCSSQHLTYVSAQSAWMADSAGVTNE